MRLTADGRARFAGDDHRAHHGSLAAQVDFRTLAAWVDTQHLEELVVRRYGSGIFDAPGIDIRIERGADVQLFTTAYSAIFPLRLEGVVLALEGELQRAQWRAVDEFTPFLGSFLIDTRQLDVYADARPEMRAVGAAVRRECDNPLLERSGRTFRLRCEGGRTSTVVETTDGFVADGDAVVTGRYRRDHGGVQPRPLGM